MSRAGCPFGAGAKRTQQTIIIAISNTTIKKVGPAIPPRLKKTGSPCRKSGTMKKTHTKNTTYVMIILVAAGVIINALGGGVRSNFGIIIQPLSDKSGVSYASISFVLGIAQLMYGVTQPLWGMLAMKKSNAMVILCGIPLMAGGLILTALTQSSSVMLISLGLMVGGGAGALCFGMIMGAISPILGSKRAATASGILNAGSGIGGATLSPAIQTVMCEVSS